MKKIKILEMIDKPFLGGGQINLLSLAKSLDKKNFDVSVCSQSGGPFVDKVRENNIKHFPVCFRKQIDRRIVREIVSILKNNHFDILHTHGGIAGLYGRWAAHKCGVPVVVHTLHGIHYLHYRNIILKYLYMLLERFFSKFTDAVIFVSDADRKKAERLELVPISKMVVVKNGIDFSESKTEVTATKKKEDIRLGISQPVVGTVARLHRQKGIPYFLKAALKICRVFTEAKIIIVGSGPLKKKLRRMAQNLSLGDSVSFLGEREDGPQLISLYDVFVLPSLWEGLPYVLMEAAALAKPVVVTDVDGVSELVKNMETGILVPPGDPESLARAVIYLLQNKEVASKFGENFKKDITSRYSLSRMVYETESLYLRLYKERSKV